MEKKLRNTELIAFRVTKRLKEKLDNYCVENGMGIAAVMRCLIVKATVENEEADSAKKP